MPGSSTQKDSLERWGIAKRKVHQDGYLSATNYLDPPVGSDPHGVDGYKTLGYELVEHLAVAAVDAILVPTARGDLLWGIYSGLAEAVAAGQLPAMPRLIAVAIRKPLSDAKLLGTWRGGNLLAPVKLNPLSAS